MDGIPPVMTLCFKMSLIVPLITTTMIDLANSKEWNFLTLIKKSVYTWEWLHLMIIKAFFRLPKPVTPISMEELTEWRS